MSQTMEAKENFYPNYLYALQGGIHTTPGNSRHVKSVKVHPKPTIYVFSGYSGAGKDTAASVLESAVSVKFASPGKRALEAIYRLPDGFMDDRIARQHIAPYSGGKTYLQVLIDFWRHRDLLVGSELFGQQTKEEMLYYLRKKLDICVTDMRNPNELEVVAELYNQGYPVQPVWIVGGQALESDVYQETLYRQLCALVGSMGTEIVNDSDSAKSFKSKVWKTLYYTMDSVKI